MNEEVPSSSQQASAASNQAQETPSAIPQGTPLKEAFQALKNLENVRHENIAAEKKNFEFL